METSVNRELKRLNILDSIDIKIDSNSYQLIKNLINHPYSVVMFKSNYVDGIDNNVCQQINQLCEDLAVNDECKELLLNIKNYDKNGIGKGEVLLSFLFDDVEYNGGRVNYDITAKNGNYEVKCYKNAHSAIRLGTDATVSNFNAYKIVTDIFSRIDELVNINTTSNEIINNIRELYLSNIDGTKFNVKTGIYAGEISNAVYNRINELLLYLDDVVNSNALKYNIISNDNTEYLIDINYIDIDNNTIKCNNIYKVDVDTDIYITSKIYNFMNYISKIDIKNVFNNFCNEAINKINKMFYEHPMIIINQLDVGPMCLGLYTEFKYYSITKNGIKIKPKNTPENNNN